MTKRSFSINTQELASEVPTLSVGNYAGVITGASVIGKENKQYINIVPTREYKTDMVNPETGKVGMNVIVPNKFHIDGTIYYHGTLNSKSAIQQLQVDEPRVFGGKIVLSFDKETFQFNTKANVTFENWLKALGLKDVDFNSQVDWEENPDIEIPEELAEFPEAVDILNGLAYYRAYFSLVCEAANNLPAVFNVIKIPDYRDPNTQNTVIDTDGFNPKRCGIIAYTEGHEEDLND